MNSWFRKPLSFRIFTFETGMMMMIFLFKPYSIVTDWYQVLYVYMSQGEKKGGERKRE
jgi:hypothetical protein